MEKYTMINAIAQAQKYISDTVTTEEAAHAIANPHISGSILARPELMALQILEAVRLDLVSDVLTYKGSKNKVAAAKRILKNANSSHVLYIQGAADLPDGKQVITSAYYGVCLNNALPGLVQSPDPEQLGQWWKRLDIRVKNNMHELPKITGEECKLHSKTHKKDKFGNRQPMPWDDTWVNNDYLYDLLVLLPGCKAYQDNNPLHPIIFTGDAGTGVLMPIKAPRE